MRIKINAFDYDSINEAYEKVKAYKNSLNSKVNEIVSKLTVIGAEIVEYQYFSSHEDYEVSCVVNGNSSMIIAEGDNVVFLEFGTGVLTEDNTDEMDSKGLPPIFAGSWSNTEGLGQFRPDHQYWYHNHIKYQGTMPMQGFYFASKEIKEQAVNIATRVFKK